MVDVKPSQRSGHVTNRLQSPYKGAPYPLKMAEPLQQPPHSGKSARHPLESTVPRKAVCPHKKTDFRHALWVKERKALRDKAKRTRFRVEMGKQPKGNTVTIDTSKARSNIDVLRLCVQELGWREYPMGKRDGMQCDIHWHSAHYQENPDLYTGWVNKFPGMVDVVKKVSLTRTLDIMQNLFPDEYDFHPQSWYLPQQFAEFSDAARRALIKTPKRKPYYIVKPDEGSQGEGIYLITDPKEYTFNNRQHVVQQYIAHPLLLEELKFDLRIYVVLVRLDPLKIYLHGEGLARFCTVPYQPPTQKNYYESFMHLTNYSLNKRSSTYVHTDTDDDGSKRTLTSVMRRLDYMGYDVVKLEADIEKLVVKTVIAMTPELKVEMNAAIPPGKPGPKCFQILGFDILITDQLKPILLEVNANPSLRIDYEREVALGIYEHIHSPVDEEIKKSLVLSTLKTVAPKKGQRRRKRSNKAVRCSSADNVSRDNSTDQEKSESETHKSEKVRDSNIPVRKYKSSEGVRRQSKDQELDHHTKTTTKKQETMTDDDNNNENVDPGDDGDEEDDDEYEDEVVEHGPDYNPFDDHHLKEIYPALYGEHVTELLIMEKTVEIFLSCLGVRASLRMGATSFRNFTRKGRLAGTGFNNASLDILFIDLQRRWEYANPGTTTGLCYQGFLEAFFLIARRKFPSETPLESVRKFLSHCAENMESADSRLTRQPTYLPRLTQLEKTDRRTEDLRQFPGPEIHSVGRSSRRNIDVQDFSVFQSTQDGGKYSNRRQTKMNFVDGKE